MFSYSTDPAYNDIVPPQEFLRILAKSRISEEFLDENFGPPGTFQEFSSWIHPWQKIFQEMFAYRGENDCSYNILKKRKTI